MTFDFMCESYTHFKSINLRTINYFKTFGVYVTYYIHNRTLLVDIIGKMYSVHRHNKHLKTNAVFTGLRIPACAPSTYISKSNVRNSTYILYVQKMF